MDICKGSCTLGVYDDHIDESTCSEFIEDDYNDHLLLKYPEDCVIFKYCPCCGKKLNIDNISKKYELI